MSDSSTPGLLAIVFAIIVAVGWPLYDYFIDWRQFLRIFRDNPHRARVREYRNLVVIEWVLVAISVSVWRGAAMQIPTGWRLWVAIAPIALLVASQTANILKAIRRERTRAWVREHMAHVQPLLPATNGELAGFLCLSVTAGICEEFLFRGFLVWAFAPVLGWWGAAAVSLVSFGMAHAYQGRKGVIQAAGLGAVMMILVALTQSLLPVMLLHLLIDVGSGILAWIALTKSDARAANS